MSLFWRLFTPMLGVVAVSAGIVAWLLLSPAVGVSAALLVALIALAGAVLLAGAVGLRLALDPLDELASALDETARAGRGPVRIRRDDEVGRLASGYNALLERMAAQHRAALRARVRAQEEERLRISRELHDEVGQLLTLVRRDADTLAESGEEAAIRLRENASRSLDQVRDIATSLRPGVLDDLGLAAALRQLVASVAEHDDLDVAARVERIDGLSDEAHIAIYRVAQEALTNVLRHAQANRLVVIARADGDDAYLTVRDDGVGGADRSGTGLSGMAERADLVGGSLVISSPAGAGTTVSLRVPRDPS